MKEEKGGRTDRRLLWLAGMGMLIACAAALWLWLSSHTRGGELACRAIDDTRCDLYLDQSPVASLVVEVEHESQLQPFNIRLQPLASSPLEVKRASVELIGLNEYMGINIYPLKPLNQAALGYSGVLPVCTVAEMRWLAQLSLDTNQGLMHSHMTFTSHRNP